MEINRDKHIETERLILLPGKNSRDNEAFLSMLEHDGDFQIFRGLPCTEQSLSSFENYLEQDFLFSVFSKNHPNELLGYAGIAFSQDSYEAEFYIKASARNRGYCEETVNAICKAAFAGDFTQGGQSLILHEIYATTLKKNLPARRVLEKCGFAPLAADPNLFAQILVDPWTEKMYCISTVRYVLLKNP